MRDAEFAIIKTTDAVMTIKDIGDHSRVLTVTNDVDGVVKRVVEMGLGKRRLLCTDSDGITDEIVVEGGKFKGFNILWDNAKGQT